MESIQHQYCAIFRHNEAKELEETIRLQRKSVVIDANSRMHLYRFTYLSLCRYRVALSPCSLFCVVAKFFRLHLDLLPTKGQKIQKQNIACKVSREKAIVCTTCSSSSHVFVKIMKFSAKEWIGKTAAAK